jgi:hypothetical protein
MNHWKSIYRADESLTQGVLQKSIFGYLLGLFRKNDVEKMANIDYC